MRKRKFLAILLACTMVMSGAFVNDKSIVSAYAAEDESTVEESQKLNYERSGMVGAAESTVEEYQELSDEVSDFEQKDRLFGDDSPAEHADKEDIEIANWYYESSASNHTRSIGNIYAICEKE